MVIRKSNHTQRIQWPMNKYYPFQAVTTKYTFCYMYLPMQLLYFCPLKSGIRDTYYRVQKANPTFNGVVQPDWIPFLWILLRNTRGRIHSLHRSWSPSFLFSSRAIELSDLLHVPFCAQIPPGLVLWQICIISPEDCLKVGYFLQQFLKTEMCVFFWCFCVILNRSC